MFTQDKFPNAEFVKKYKIEKRDQQKAFEIVYPLRNRFRPSSKFLF